MQKAYWPNGVNQILSKVLNGKRTILEARNYMDQNYIIGESRKAFKHVAFENTSADTFNELKVYNLLNDAIKLGHGKDLNLESVFR